MSNILPRQQKLIDSLEAARLEVVSTHGLWVTDLHPSEPNVRIEMWQLDNTKIIRKLDDALRESSG